MVDIHCHIVPGVDDGSTSVEMSLEMIAAAKRSGVTAILTTPHIRGRAEDVVVHSFHKENFQKVLDTRPDIDLYLGCEVRVTPETHDIISHSEFTSNERSKYILLELEFDKVPAYFSQLIFEYRLAGITPIVAHPERNVGVLQNPEYAIDFVRQGALLQVTNGSVLGELGESFQRCAINLIECGLVSFLASDAHNISTRPFTNWSETYEFVQNLEKKGNSLLPINADYLCTHNPFAVCQGTPIPSIELDEPLLSRIRSRLLQATEPTVKRKRFFFM